MKTKEVLCYVEVHCNIPKSATIIVDTHGNKVGFKLKDGTELRPALCFDVNCGERLIGSDKKLRKYGAEIFNYSEAGLRETS
jgi:hypothetical protein